MARVVLGGGGLTRIELALIERAPGVNVEDIVSSTAAPFAV